MKILVTGANGFIGSAVCQQLMLEGHTVFAGVRSLSQLDSNKNSLVTPIHIGNLAEKSSHLAELFLGIDAIVHTAARVHVMKDVSADPLSLYRAVNLEGTKQLVQAAIAAKVQRFIFLSSIKVNGEETTDHPFTELDLPHPQDPYAQSKYEAEEYLLSQTQHIKIIILRCPLVYGKGVKANFEKLLKLVKLGLPLPLGGLNNQRSLLYVENLVSAISRCISKENIPSNLYLVADQPPVSTTKLMQIIAAATQRKLRLFTLPPYLFKAAMFFLPFKAILSRLLGSLAIDSQKIQTELMWQPPFSLEQGIEHSYSDRSSLINRV